MVSRRGLLRRGSLVGLGVLAGCSNIVGGPRDSDGDGMIDSEDYAPDDPAVQERSDVSVGTTDRTETTADGSSDTEGESTTAQSQFAGGPLNWPGDDRWNDLLEASGVAHESVAGTSHDSEATLRHGYSYTEPTFRPSLAAYFPLDGITRDVTDAGYQGTGTDLATTDGVLGGEAYRFSDDARIEVDHHVAGVDRSRTMTVTAWVRPDHVPVGDETFRVFEQGNAFDDNAFVFNLKPDGVIDLGLKGYNVWNGWESDPGAFTAGEYQHLACVYDARQEQTSFYVDGQFHSRDTTNDAAGTGFPRVPDPDADRCSIAHTGVVPNSSSTYNGALAELRLYDRALEPAEVEQLASIAATGSARTERRAFTNPARPRLDNLEYAGEEDITVTVTGSPGSDDPEAVTQSLTGASSYELDWDRAHTEFELRVEFSDSDPTTTATVQQIELVA